MSEVIVSKPAEKLMRLMNFIIDSVIFMFIVFLHAMIFDAWLGIVPEEGFELFPIYLLMIYVLYYLLFEWFFQRTPGKFVTKTKVVSMDGQKVGIGKLLARNVSRLIPLEFISFLFLDRGLHDLFSDTYVIKR